MIAAGMLAALSATPAAAQDAPVSPAQPQASPAVCLNAGNSYKVGEYACIAACHGERRLARCDAVGQAVSWTYVSNACPSAMINTPWPSDWSQIPVAADMTPVPLAVRMSAIDASVAPLIGSHFSQSVLTR